MSTTPLLDSILLKIAAVGDTKRERRERNAQRDAASAARRAAQATPAVAPPVEAPPTAPPVSTPRAAGRAASKYGPAALMTAITAASVASAHDSITGASAAEAEKAKDAEERLVAGNAAREGRITAGDAAAVKATSDAAAAKVKSDTDAAAAQAKAEHLATLKEEAITKQRAAQAEAQKGFVAKKDLAALTAERAGAADALEHSASGETFKNLANAYTTDTGLSHRTGTPGVLDYGKAAWDHPAAAAQKWWDNIKGGDVGTIGGTAAVTAAALFGVYGLSSLMGKKRKTAAASDSKGYYDKQLAQDMADSLKVGNPPPVFNPQTGMQEFRGANGATRQVPPDLVGGRTGYDRLTNTYVDKGVADVEIDDAGFRASMAQAVPTVPPGKPEPPPGQVQPSLATRAGETVLGALPDSVSDTLNNKWGIKSETMGYAAAGGVGALAILGGVLLANKLRKSKKA